MQSSALFKAVEKAITWNTGTQVGPIHRVVTSQNLWPRYDRYFVAIMWHNVWS